VETLSRRLFFQSHPNFSLALDEQIAKGIESRHKSSAPQDFTG